MAVSTRFVCDGSLGGLARWLRAAGCEVTWRPGLTGRPLLEEADRAGGVLLSSDHEVFLRRDVREGRRAAFHVPSSLDRFRQLAHVVRAFGLRLREPRCMACGGALAAVAKDAVQSRIPPRTALWKDEYFVCRDCDRLFWQGTHWERIVTRLRAAGLSFDAR
jgi:hypothetical protein